MKPTPAAEPARLFFGPCELRTDTRELWVAGTRTPVRRRVFDLIVHLVRHRPGVVRHGELMHAVWHRWDLSQTVLARAIMEARQACGEAADQPRFFVSVHGVGYRFAGDVRVDAERGCPSAGGGDGNPTVQLQVQVGNARQALAEHRLEEARQLAEAVVASSHALGARSERVRALVVCALAATLGNRMPEAARLANHALQMAMTEGHAPLIAEARVALGGVHVLAGDRTTGIGHLREALPELAAPGHEADLARCLRWLLQALREQGDLEAALALCRDSVASAPRCEGLAFARPGRLDEVQLLAELGDRLAEAGDARGARERFEAGLAAGRSLLPDLAAPELARDRAMCLDRLSMLLERLGRVAEARDMAEACDALRQRLPGGLAWPDDEGRPRLRLQRARLASHAGDLDAVLLAADAALAEASVAPASEPQAELYRLAAEVASRCGAHERASAWERRRYEILVGMHRARSASLAAIIAAELNAHLLRDELDRARAEARDVLVENAALRSRVRQLEGAFALAPQTGLAAGDTLDELLEPAFVRARARGLPLCIGVLEPVGLQALTAGRAEALLPHLQRAASILAGHPDVAGPAFDLGGGRVAFVVRDAGLTRSRAVCDELAARLAGTDVLPGARLPVVRWHGAVADAAGFRSLRTCVQSLAWPVARSPHDAARPMQPAERMVETLRSDD